MRVGVARSPSASRARSTSELKRFLSAGGGLGVAFCWASIPPLSCWRGPVRARFDTFSREIAKSSAASKLPIPGSSPWRQLWEKCVHRSTIKAPWRVLAHGFLFVAECRTITAVCSNASRELEAAETHKRGQLSGFAHNHCNDWPTHSHATSAVSRTHLHTRIVSVITAHRRVLCKGRAGYDRPTASELRKVCADAVAADPDPETKALMLGMPLDQ